MVFLLDELDLVPEVGDGDFESAGDGNGGGGFFWYGVGVVEFGDGFVGRE